MQLATVQRIPPVMSGTVRDEGDEFGVVLFGFAGLLGERMEEQVDEVDVAELVASADVVDGTRGTFAQDGVYADVEAVAVNGDGFTSQGIPTFCPQGLENYSKSHKHYSILP